MDSYETRAAQFDFAKPDEIHQLLQDPSTLLLDVRSDTERTTQGAFDRSIHTTCTAADCVELRLNPEQLVADKMANVVLHCRSGRRVTTAKRLLREAGYTGRLLNAGGYDDLKPIMEQLK